MSGRNVQRRDGAVADDQLQVLAARRKLVPALSATHKTAMTDKIAYTYKEAVVATGASRNTLSKMVGSGELEVRRRGKRVFIPRSELERQFGLPKADPEGQGRPIPGSPKTAASTPEG